ncbi:hypothetical protein CLV75_3389 [Ruegeria conchae]|uniref:Uncharacterized protein n=3 Tax=Ruegeria conchae TaxID=981384 RepID=A0A497Z9E9_9RHOB|nr:hypothetical protein CLV75_3389 [Ruegeria conchae]
MLSMLKVIDHAVKFIEAAFRGAVFLLLLSLTVVAFGVVWFVAHVSWGIYQSKKEEAERIAACHFVSELVVQIGNQLLTLKASSSLQVNPKEGPRIVGELILLGGETTQVFCMSDTNADVLPAFGFLRLNAEGYNNFLLRNGFDTTKLRIFSVYSFDQNLAIKRPFNLPFETDGRVVMSVTDIRGDLLVTKVLQTNAINEDGFWFTSDCSKLDDRSYWICRIWVEDHDLEFGYKLGTLVVEGEQGFWIDADRTYEAISK